MITFWIAAILATALAVGLIALFANRPVAVSADASRTVYRRQLGEIDELVARGVLNEDERKAAHAEAARRLLGETDPDVEQAAPTGAKRFVWAIAGLAGGAAVAAYLAIGHPGLPDQPFASRLAAWKLQQPDTLEGPQIVALLEDVKKDKGNDPQFLAFLADMQMRVGNPIAAERNLQRSVAMAPNVADSWEQLGMAQWDLAGQKVTPKVRATFEKALSLDPKMVAPRFYMADDDINRGKVSEGVAALRALMPELNDQQKVMVNQRIADAEKGGAPGASDVAANPAILAMVQSLAERLKTNPNDVEGWSRLVRSYSVLKDQAKLNEALADARRYFKDRPRDLAVIEAAATSAPQ